MRPLGSASALQRRRERAVALVRAGLRPVDVARKLGVTQRAVRYWQAAFRRSGLAGLAARPAPGRPSRLTEAGKAKLDEALLAGARAAGFPTDLWTCPRVAEVIRRRFGIRYHVDHVGRVLHAMGWSPQRPTRRAVERDEPRIEQWVKEQWPAIEKGRRR